MNVKETRKKETVRRILDAAAQVFAEIGYQGARIDRIASRAGVNKAMIYYHIGDKKALYTRVLHEVFRGTAAHMADNINRAETPLAKIKAYIHSIGETLEKHPQLPHIMMRELASGGLDLPELVVHDLASIIRSISTVIMEGRTRGEFLDVDPLVLHLMVIGGIAYYQASAPLRLKYSHMMEELIEDKADKNGFDLLSQIERIILSALIGS
jgi:AcrR family transcriptional regulator